MSRILESVIGAEREAACRCNDEALAHNAPIAPTAPVTLHSLPRPRAALSRATVFDARMAMIKIALCCAAMGFAAGQWLGRTNYPMHLIKPDAHDMHKLPGTNDVPARPRKVV